MRKLLLAHLPDVGTNRLESVKLDQEDIDGTVMDFGFTCDDAGNVTSMIDGPTNTTVAGERDAHWNLARSLGLASAMFAVLVAFGLVLSVGSGVAFAYLELASYWPEAIWEFALRYTVILAIGAVAAALISVLAYLWALRLSASHALMPELLAAVAGPAIALMIALPFFYIAVNVSGVVLVVVVSVVAASGYWGLFRLTKAVSGRHPQAQ